jgi:mannonate dehydratase
MKIRDARVIVCCPGRNFVTLKVITDEGLTGLGDATLNGREQAVVSYLEEHCIPALIGKDPRNIEDIWQYFYRGVYWRRGAVTMAALSAIDVALWDIKGKALSTPVYNLLGGRSRERIRTYTHASGRDESETLDQIQRFVEAGYDAIRVQTGVPGLDGTYGVATEGGSYEPAQAGIAQEHRWDTQKYLRFAPKLFAAVRSRFGPDLDLLHDVHHRLTPIEAARLGKELEAIDLLWLEDPVRGELQEGLRWVRRHTTTPLAIGEVYNTVYDCTTLITEQLIDYLRMPPGHGGGITHLSKVASFAGFYHVMTGFHGATDLSPVALAAALHLDLSVNNFGIQEYMPHPTQAAEVFTTRYRFDRGYFELDDTPGLGVDIDETVAKKFPYEAAALPISRKLDGTLFDW